MSEKKIDTVLVILSETSYYDVNLGCYKNLKRMTYIVEKHLHNQIHPVTNSRKIWEKRWNGIQGLEKLITKTSKKFLISQGLFQSDHNVCV